MCRSKAEERLLELDGQEAEREIIQAEVPLVRELQELEAKWLSDVCHREVLPENALVQKVVALILAEDGELLREETIKEILKNK